jgi:hypothetical protein
MILRTTVLFPRLRAEGERESQVSLLNSLAGLWFLNREMSKGAIELTRRAATLAWVASRSRDR